MEAAALDRPLVWQPDTPKLRPPRLVLVWIVAAASVRGAAAIAPGFELKQLGAGFLTAALIAVLNAIIPPLLAAIRMPFALLSGFFTVLFANAGLIYAAGQIAPKWVYVGGFGDAFLAALFISAVSMILQVGLGINDDDEYSLRVTKRIAKRRGIVARTDDPGIIYLEIDGLALPVLRDA